MKCNANLCIQYAYVFSVYDILFCYKIYHSQKQKTSNNMGSKKQDEQVATIFEQVQKGNVMAMDKLKKLGKNEMNDIRRERTWIKGKGQSLRNQSHSEDVRKGQMATKKQIGRGKSEKVKDVKNNKNAGSILPEIPKKNSKVQLVTSRQQTKVLSSVNQNSSNIISKSLKKQHLTDSKLSIPNSEGLKTPNKLNSLKQLYQQIIKLNQQERDLQEQIIEFHQQSQQQIQQILTKYKIGEKDLINQEKKSRIFTKNQKKQKQQNDDIWMEELRQITSKNEYLANEERKIHLFMKQMEEIDKMLEKRKKQIQKKRKRVSSSGLNDYLSRSLSEISDSISSHSKEPQSPPPKPHKNDPSKKYHKMMPVMRNKTFKLTQRLNYHNEFHSPSNSPPKTKTIMENIQEESEEEGNRVLVNVQLKKLLLE